jgi:hypothetical protein
MMGIMMPSTDDTTGRLLQELADAKVLPIRFKQQLDGGSDVGDEIREADKRIEALEKQAKEAMKKLGCVSPQTRMISQGMADMLIAWYSFKDSLGS